MKKKFRHFISLSALFLVLPFVLSKVLPYQDVNDQYQVRGKFDESLLKINSLETLKKQLDQTSDKDTLARVEYLDSVLKYRFYHGTCRYNFNENWLAYALGKLIWDDFRMIVKAEHILQKKVAVCNQLNIVFQAMLKENDITYRTVGLNHHLITEVFVKNKWHYFDADYEPTLSPRPSAQELIENRDLFNKVYNQTLGDSFNPHFEEILATSALNYYPTNSTLAYKLSAFQSMCFVVSEYGWILMLLFSVILKYV